MFLQFREQMPCELSGLDSLDCDTGGMYFQRFPARFGVGLDRQLQSHHGRAVLFRCRINIHHVDLHSSRSDAGTS